MLTEEFLGLFWLEGRVIDIPCFAATLAIGKSHFRSDTKA
jgi:hypothetical protein